MIKSRLAVKLVLMAVLLLFSSLGVGCGSSHDFDKTLRAITKPYRFGVAKWELATFGEGIGKVFGGRPEAADGGVSEVAGYFAAVERMKKLGYKIESVRAGTGQGDLPSLEAELDKLQQQNKVDAETVSRVLETQIREVLSQQGIFNPVYKYLRLQIGFPPVNFKLGRMPHLLVVSPRDRIESIREVVLLPDMSLEDMEGVEDKVDELDVSSLVVSLGGFATYPSLITNEGNLRFTIDTAAEEWLHQYLAFKPLGFHYLWDLTGIRRDYEVATMNETLAGMVSREIGGIVYESYYKKNETDRAEPVETGFDFNKEMREIRRAVDDYLARGEIEQAEEFMEQRRQYLVSRGYHIRKLNQAYFAFHGAYADRPTSISPIGVEMKQLRSQSASLKDFLETVSAMTSRQDLAESIR